MSDKILKLEQAQTLYQDLRGRIDALPTQNDIPSVPVQDVQVNGVSVLSDGVANVPYGTNSAYGAVKGREGWGIGIQNGEIYVNEAATSNIKNGTVSYKPIVPNHQHESVFYGLAKAANADMASLSSVTVGQYPEAQKIAIRAMLGATSSNVIAVQDEQPTDTDTKVWLPETEPTGIEVPTYAEFQALDAAVVKKTDIASTSVAGIVKVNGTSFGLFVDTDSTLKTLPANAAQIKAGTDVYKQIAPYRQHESIYYGLSKLAGVDLASETVTVGTYPATASAAIRTMLGAVGDVQVNGTSVVSNGVANIPIASTDIFGAIKINSAAGIDINSETGKLRIASANGSEVRLGTDVYRPIVPGNEHTAVFYGLAKAAGDTTQRSIVFDGVYTSEAKAAIHTMLGINPASIAAQVDIPLVETVSGTTPTITGQPNVRYVCGEISTITITPPASGSVDIIFESGSTATTMTVPSTVKWPAWFDATTLEADTTYEILITDGVYGSVMTWVT